MIKKTLDYVVETFGFSNWSEYTNSLIHKDLVAMFMFNSSLVASVTMVIQEYFGIKPVLIGAILALLVWELGSGLIHMHKSKEQFTSDKFGRFALKAFFWVSFLYIIYSFRSQFEGTNIIAFEMFDWIHTGALVYMFSEYLVSVDENMAKITKRESTFLKIVINKIKSFIEPKVEDK